MRWTYFIAAMHQLGADARDASRRNLGSRKRGSNNGWGVTKKRTLQKSLEYQLWVDDDGGIHLSVDATGDAKAYGKFVEMGVSGTQKDYDTPYKYSNKMPPIDEILGWMKAKPVRLRDKSGKFVKATDALKQSTAYLIARSIQREGVPPLRFAEEGLQWAMERHRPTLAQAAVMDIGVYMRNNLNEIPRK